MFLGASESCKSYLSGKYLILSMWPVFTPGFNCEILRKNAEGGGN
jgi:hypothetical protein